MELGDKHKAILNDVISFFWQQGGVRSPQMSAGLQETSMILFAPKPPERKKEEEGKGDGGK